MRDLLVLENLKEQKIWVCWKFENKKDSSKPSKVPYSAITGQRTGSNEPFRNTWTDYETAYETYKKRGYNGVGFIVPKNIAFFDIDGKGVEDPLVKNFQKKLDTYAEISQSGQGIHFYFYIDSSKVPTETNKEGKLVLSHKYYQKNPTNGLELYFGIIANRFSVFTGNTLEDKPMRDCTSEALEILDSYMLRNKKNSTQPKATNTKSIAYEFENADKIIDTTLPEDVDPEVRAIVKKILKQKNCEKFKSLFFEGDKSKYRNGTQIDDSRADAALCSMIAFRTGPDRADLIEKVFNASALVRDKWTSRADYRSATIQAGINACNGVFHTSTKPVPNFIYTNSKGQIKVNAALLAENIRFNEKYFLVRDNGKQGILIYVYEGGVYKLFAPEMFKSIIKGYIADYDLSILKMNDVNEVYNHLITDRNYVRQSELNSDESLINFANCLLKVSADKIQVFNHSVCVYSTIQIPCNWTGKDSPTPVFDAYLARLCNYDNALISLCLQLIGVCLSNVKGYRMKKSPFFYGDGNTGKSQLKALVEKLLGEGNYVGIDLQEIEARFGTGVIYGNRLAGSSDMSFVSVDELKTFKKITGGDSLFAEFKGHQGFEYTYSGMLWFCMNRLPKFGGDDGSWVYERILPIHCVNVIPQEEQDKCLLDKMYAEREGIVYKAIKALQTVIANGYRFSEPQCVAEQRQQYMVENNTVSAFYNECLFKIELQPTDSFETVSRIYDVYRAWCKDNNNGFAKTAKEFRDTIASLVGSTFKDISIHRVNGTFFKNLALHKEIKEHYQKAFFNGSDGGGNEDFH